MDQELWDTVSPAYRIKLQERAIQELKPNVVLTPQNHFIISKYLDAENVCCERCEERVPHFMIYSPDDKMNFMGSSLEDTYSIMDEMFIEEWCCAWCIVDVKDDKQRKLLKQRTELLEKREPYLGMPTLEYDEIIEGLEVKIVEIERQLMRTCDECGGEIAPDIEGEWLSPPENGWCAEELDGCEVFQ